MNFTSKRNRVRLEKGVIIKQHSSQAALEREARHLKFLFQKGLAVPALLRICGDTLRLEYIPGATYQALVERMTAEMAGALARWLAEYHQITGLLRGDVNLRNFLWAGRRCVGLDFEEDPPAGEPETDHGKILAFAATYKPAFTAKKAECLQLMLQALISTGGEKGKIRQAYLREISAMNRRRNDSVDLDQAALFFDKPEVYIE